MTNQPGENPVTFIVSRIVRAGREEAYEEWVRGICAAVQSFEGYLGATVIRPGDHAAPEYVIIFRFEHYAHLAEWEKSPVRRMWLNEVDALTEGPTKVQVITGLEYWFNAPDSTPMPSRHKQAFVSWLAIFPLSTLATLLLSPVVMPLLVRTMLVSGIVILLMSYVVMPRLTRLLAGWIFPPS
jgi:hypothetical protein